MGGCYSLCAKDTTETLVLTPEEREARRAQAAQAAEGRQKDFRQGGGGEKVKAKAARKEAAEQKAIAEGRGPNSRNAMQWQV
mmetsp:Transcript_34490/g.45594  ORF Transcript_34490/g.45594 Transcript_34490/m.45594 type:complete len:82 (-) Transcript_34490:420-665(-)|eukprot:CAMPEP_0117756962 /NCGR_PEP_ID=MMETSP0947-20121206/14426_1 /TAXON_ID=44440 /ORGANISM="Chattonella subsalsa, Strain CCMP2191" /LENGTH=81 /DNA_ID=CAMNT_0005576721 /DNA_START=78 /DNA_END=323 /DNA_ORIENTATION=-